MKKIVEIYNTMREKKAKYMRMAKRRRKRGKKEDKNP